ncbi:hypothetical protein ANN_10350 [Periplaneta americana]|uniref:Uncharacterized protein n=1 Tax=Periplaneta americana TaxID=6978 RepID=A0ABQ8TSN4_PERAM|nr:hypothetical protein ANN_10350 [Periplaneta americana]
MRVARRPGFDPDQVVMEFVVDKADVAEDFSRSSPIFLCHSTNTLRFIYTSLLSSPYQFLFPFRACDRGKVGCGRHRNLYVVVSRYYCSWWWYCYVSWTLTYAESLSNIRRPWHRADPSSGEALHVLVWSKKSLYRRFPEATGYLDRPPWNVVKRRWMASTTSTRGGPTRGRSFALDRQGALGEVAEAGMVYGFLSAVAHVVRAVRVGDLWHVTHSI